MKSKISKLFLNTEIEPLFIVSILSLVFTLLLDEKILKSGLYAFLLATLFGAAIGCASTFVCGADPYSSQSPARYYFWHILLSFLVSTLIVGSRFFIYAIGVY